MRFRRTVPALLLAATLAASGSAVASAAPAAHGSVLRISVTWKRGHVAEVVHVRRDPHRIPVVAIGNCSSTGIANTSGRTVRKAGSVSRTRCPKGWWVSVGYITGRYPHKVYHAVRGSKNLNG